MELNYAEHIFRSPEFSGVIVDAITFFEQTSAYALSLLDTFDGCGVYGLYYMGRHALYTKIAARNHAHMQLPIYIGKAVPTGWRTGREQSTQEPKLYQRLQEHARSIHQVTDLNLSDFQCKFVLLDSPESDLIVPLEAELIRKYHPVWNTVIDGFGNHDPGSGRYNQAPSEWDIVHPGRNWAEKLTGNPPELETVRAKVLQALDLLELS